MSHNTELPSEAASAVTNSDFCPQVISVQPINEIVKGGSGPQDDGGGFQPF
jgi:hypothetical protein